MKKLMLISMLALSFLSVQSVFAAKEKRDDRQEDRKEDRKDDDSRREDRKEDKAERKDK